MNREKTHITAKQVSRILDIPLPTVYRLIKRGIIKSIKVGGKILCLLSDVEYYKINGTYHHSTQETSHNDRRKHSRINTDFDFQYSINLKQHKHIVAKGIVRNLNFEGAFLSGQKDEISIININDPVTLRFILPLEENSNKKIIVKGRVLRKDGNGFAIKFRQVDRSVKDAIKEYVG